MPRVDPLKRHDAAIGGQDGVQLAVAHVNANDRGRTLLEHAIREAPR